MLLTVAAAFPSKKRQDYMIEKLVELGVREIVPLVSERSVVKFSGEKIEKLSRRIIEASKQCGRSRLMKISPAVRAERLRDALGGETPLLVCDPASGSAPVHDVLRETATAGGARPETIALAVGPEGGFTPDEMEMFLQGNAHKARLGSFVLRTETAVVAMASAVMAYYESAGI